MLRGVRAALDEYSTYLYSVITTVRGLRECSLHCSADTLTEQYNTVRHAQHTTHVRSRQWPHLPAADTGVHYDYLITRHVTVVMQLANPRHPRPVHISRYCPLSRSNIPRYGPDFDPEYNKKKGWIHRVGSLAVRVINVLLTAHVGNTVLDT